MRIVISRLGLFAVAAAAVTVAPPAGSAAEAPVAPPVPRAGCTTFTDDKGDGTIGGTMPNDPDLDIVDVVLASPPGLIRAYVHVDKLGFAEYAVGHQFSLTFQLESKPVVIFVGQDDPAEFEAVHEAGAGLVGRLNGVTYNGVAVADAKLEAVWDEKASTVIMTTDRASLEKASKLTLADGLQVKGVTAKSLGDYVYSTIGADTAAAKTPETQVYTLGDNACFAPPEGKLALQLPTAVVAGHTAVVGGVLSTATGTAVAGKAVTVTVAGKTATVTSGADGKFSASFAMNNNAGSYPVTASWAGDDSLTATTVTAPLTVKIQPTSTALTATLSSTGATVTATLLNDLRKPVAGQPITWYVDGRAVATYRTDSLGRSTLRTARGKAVKAAYAGLRNRYAPSSASRRT